MKTTIEWTATPVPEGIKCPECKGSGLVVKKKEKTDCDLCEGTGTAYKLPGFTFNGWWGCQKVSRGCKECYAETFSNRFVKPSVWGPNAPRRFFDDKHWDEPLKWQAEAKASGIKRKVFAFSMSDILEDRADLIAPRARLFKLVGHTPDLIWLFLTKRIENGEYMLPAEWLKKLPNNVWLGTTIEEQAVLYARLEALTKFNGTLFLSCEPLVGPLDFKKTPHTEFPAWPLFEKLSQVIVGGESGAKANPMHPGWVRDIRDQCREGNVAFFFKQWGEWMPYESLTSDMQPKHPHFIDINGKFIDNKEDATGAQEIYRMGKSKAGRILDGKTYDGFPEPVNQ